MKICWDMLEGVRLTKNGKFAKGTATYVYKETCTRCGVPYLTESSRQSEFCTQVCANSGKNNPMYGKTQTIESRKKMSEHRSYPTGVLHPNYKGDKAGYTMYNTHKDTLGLYEEICKQKGTEVLEVRCAYCNQWYIPTRYSVNARLDSINSLNKGEQRFYCSENCKQACPTYNRRKYPKGFKHTTSREVDPYLRQMVFELDNWECQICGASGINVTLHCHHILGYALNRMFANDVNNCITLCKHCHKMIHSRIGCRYIDLVCKKTV